MAFLALLMLPGAAFSTDLTGSWVLEKSELTYTVTHPLHVVYGKSLSAKGKGECFKGHCDFLVGVLVKSFVSGDDNRDFHMQQITKAGLNPLIEVRAKFSGDLKEIPPEVLADMEIHFAGKVMEYSNVKLEVTPWQTDGAHVTGTIPLNLKDFDINPPSLLTLPIKNEVPVSLDMYWKKDKSKN